MSAPFVALFLVSDLGASHAVVGLFYGTFLVQPIINVFIGKWSDGAESRRPIVAFTGLWTAVGWLCLALSNQVWTACLVAILFFCVSSTPNSQIFANVKDTPGVNVGTLRAGYTAGWIVGPVAGAALMESIGTRAAFVTSAVVILLGMSSLFMGTGRFNWTQRRPGRADTPKSPRSSLVSVKSLIVGAVICMVFVGDTFKVAYMPLVVTSHISASTQTYGLILGAAAVIELVTLPLLGRLGMRVDAARLFLIGIAAAVIGYGLLSFADSLALVLLSQLIHCFVLGLFLVGAMVWVQDLWPDEPGYATSVYFGARSLAVPLGGVMGAAAAGVLGVPALFMVPAVLCVISLLAVYQLSGMRVRPLQDA